MSPKRKFGNEWFQWWNMMNCYLEDGRAVPGTGILSGAVVTRILITFVVAIWGWPRGPKEFVEPLHSGHRPVILTKLKGGKSAQRTTSLTIRSCKSHFIHTWWWRRRWGGGWCWLFTLSVSDEFLRQMNPLCTQFSSRRDDDVAAWWREEDCNYFNMMTTHT